MKIAEANAERARDIIEAAERKPGRPDLFKHPGAILDAVRVRLNMPQLDRNTLNAYRRIVDETVRTDASHPEP